PDAVAAGWLIRLPRPWRPYARLMRADRPIGFWLLAWPCWWSVALAAPIDEPRTWKLLGLFLVGAIVMRGAGCVWNDILDRDLDARVARTAARPLAAGEVSVTGALAFMAALMGIGLLVLLQFNSFTILLGLSSLVLVALYPLAKRVTDWPQAVLGLTFTWGALMGWAAVHGRLDAPALLLYVGCFFWTLGYDTIYALQDARDDAVVGVRSSARALGDRARTGIAIFYALFWVLMIAAGRAADLHPVHLVALMPAGLQLWRQLHHLDPDDPTTALAAFRANGAFGWWPFLAFALGRWLADG
ncbi:MAG: 4-hydroxybenzoate octaprenyltransferase, partial [Alphaproteobacteria bacterium]